MQSPLDVLRRYPPHDDSLAGVLRSRAHLRADHPLLIEADRTTSWGHFAGQVDALAGALQRRGVRHGDCVAVMARTGHVHPLMLYALGQLGAIMVPVNPEFTTAEAAYALGHCGVVGVLADAGAQAVACEAAAGMAAVPWVLAADDEAFESLLVGPPAHAPAGTAEDGCVIIFTSGSTGHPKGVLHSQRNVVLAGEAYVERVHLQADDRSLIVLPFFHMNGLIYQFVGTVAAGATAVLMGKFSASRFWQVVEAQRCTVTNLLVTLANILKARSRDEFRPGHTLRVICGGMQAVNEDCFRDEFRVPHRLSGYGMSEIPGVTCSPYDGPQKVGSMGMVSRHPDPDRPWAECRVVDDTGHDVADGETGEMWVRTPIVMLGYFRDPERTREAFQDGWFRTGDLVRRDADGYYFFVGRKRDMFRRRGENISALEIERALESHAEVVEAATIAVPSALGEDEILAAVVRQAGSTLTARALVDWSRLRLAAVKLPRYVAFVDALPHTGPHKIAKDRLRQDAALRAGAVDLGDSRGGEPA